MPKQSPGATALAELADQDLKRLEDAYANGVFGLASLTARCFTLGVEYAQKHAEQDGVETGPFKRLIVALEAYDTAHRDLILVDGRGLSADIFHDVRRRFEAARRELFEAIGESS